MLQGRCRCRCNAAFKTHRSRSAFHPETIDQMPLRACRSEIVTPPALASNGSIVNGGGVGGILGGAVDELALVLELTKAENALVDRCRTLQVQHDEVA